MPSPRRFGCQPHRGGIAAGRRGGRRIRRRRASSPGHPYSRRSCSGCGFHGSTLPVRASIAAKYLRRRPPTRLKSPLTNSVVPLTVMPSIRPFERRHHFRSILKSDNRWTRFRQRKPPASVKSPAIHQPPCPSATIVETLASAGAKAGAAAAILPVAGERTTSGLARARRSAATSMGVPTTDPAGSPTGFQVASALSPANGKPIPSRRACVPSAFMTQTLLGVPFANKICFPSGDQENPPRPPRAMR